MTSRLNTDKYDVSRIGSAHKHAQGIFGNKSLDGRINVSARACQLRRQIGISKGKNLSLLVEYPGGCTASWR